MSQFLYLSLKNDELLMKRSKFFLEWFVWFIFYSCFCKPRIESQVSIWYFHLEMSDISGEILFLEDLELQPYYANFFLAKLNEIYPILNLKPFVKCLY